MIHKQLYIALLGLFLFTTTNPSEHNTFTSYIPQELQKEIFKAAVGQVVDFVNIKKEENGYVSQLHKAQIANSESQTEITKTQMELHEQQKGLNIKQNTLVDGQIEDHEYEKLIKQITTIQNMKTFDPNDQDYVNLLKRAKLKLLELTKDLPELPAEEEVKKPESEKKDAEPKKDGFLTHLATYCVLGATTAATMADSIADYSFGCITSLDCFKDTFIDKHQAAINRVLVAATAYAIAYKSYSLYKAYQAERNLTDEDVFNDDLD